MAITSNPYFDELSKSYGKFVATNIIAEEARNKCSELSNTISTAKAIDYIANNKPINPEDFPDHRLDNAIDYLSYLIDNEVRDAVLASYKLSLDYNNLIYKYLTVNDEPRMSRVRILTKFIWDMYGSKYNQ